MRLFRQYALLLSIFTRGASPVFCKGTAEILRGFIAQQLGNLAGSATLAEHFAGGFHFFFNDIAGEICSGFLTEELAEITVAEIQTICDVGHVNILLDMLLYIPFRPFDRRRVLADVLLRIPHIFLQTQHLVNGLHQCFLKLLAREGLKRKSVTPKRIA